MEILEKVDWKKFSTLCLSLGNQLNSPQWRFLKAIVLEKGLESYSNGLLTYVGEDRNGCDFAIPSLNNATLEMKYTQQALSTWKKAEN